MNITSISKILPIIVMSMFFTECAASVSNMESIIKTHKNYKKLDSQEERLVIAILYRIDNSTRKAYYLDKLIDLLDAPQVAPKAFKKKQRKKLEDSVKIERKR